jgi:hypothetical protein
VPFVPIKEGDTILQPQLGNERVAFSQLRSSSDDVERLGEFGFGQRLNDQGRPLVKHQASKVDETQVRPHRHLARPLQQRPVDAESTVSSSLSDRIRELKGISWSALHQPRGSSLRAPCPEKTVD